MADEKDTKPAEAPKAEKAAPKESTVQVESNGPSTTPPVAPVRVQEASLVGDEAIAEADSVDLTPSVVSEQVPAQVTGKQAPEVDTVDVHEVSVVTDEVITDTNDPRARSSCPSARSRASTSRTCSRARPPAPRTSCPSNP
jgi:hypothetical protein